MEQTKEKHDQYYEMAHAPVGRVISKLAVPTIISMLVTSIYNMADTFFVSQLGTSASGAVGIIFSAMAIIQALSFMIGIGSGNYIARLIGAGNRELAEKLASIGFFTGFGMGLVITVLGTANIHVLVMMLGSTVTIAPYAEAYASYILLAAPFMMTSFIMNNILRFQGKALFAMVGITTGGILNIILDPVFIFGMDMGTAGAALATGISQFVSFCILLAMCNLRRDCISIDIRKFRPTLKLYGQILYGGVASLGRQGIASVATIIMNIMAQPYGDAAIAAMSIVNRFMMFVGSAMIGFGQGFQPVSAFNYGAKKYSRVREAFWFSIQSSLIVMSISALIGIVFSAPIVRMFRDDPAVISIGVTALRIQCFALFCMPFSLCGNMMFQSIGQSGKATFLSMIRSGLVFIPVLWILSQTIGLLGIQMSQTIADAVAAAITIPMVVKFFRAMPEDTADTQ